jgi:hypothetical protein
MKTHSFKMISGPKDGLKAGASRVASQVSMIRVIDKVNYVGLFLNEKLIMSRKEDDQVAGEIMRDIATNLEEFTGRPGLLAEASHEGDPWTWDEMIEKVRSSLSKRDQGESHILVSLDGGVNYSKASEGVRVIYPNLEVHDDKDGELQINLTTEGFFKDLWSGDKGSSLDNLEGNTADSVDDMIFELAGEKI